MLGIRPSPLDALASRAAPAAIACCPVESVRASEVLNDAGGHALRGYRSHAVREVVS